MKTILILLWSLPLLGSAGSPSDEYLQALAETGVAGRPHAIAEDLVIDPLYLADLKKLPQEKRAKLSDQLAKIIPRLAQARASQPISREASPLLGILLLQDMGTDAQKIEAFRDLGIYGDSLADASRAIATCEGAEGVKVLVAYAEGQFAELAKGESSTPEGHARSKPDVNIFHAVVALSGAYHPDGPVFAERLRVRLLDLAKARMDAACLAVVEQDFAKHMDDARHRRENLIREKLRSSKREDKAGHADRKISETVIDPASQTISSKKWLWPGLSAVLVLFAFACWKLMKR